MNFFKNLFRLKEVQPAVPHSVVKKPRDAKMINAGDPRIVIDPMSITHAFIALLHSDMHKFNLPDDAIASLNKHCNPSLWNKVISIKPKIKFVAFSTEVANDYPHPNLAVAALEKTDLLENTSIVINNMTISLDAGKSHSNVLVGFAYHDPNPTILIPIDSKDSFIPK